MQPQPSLAIQTQDLVRTYTIGDRAVKALRGIDLQVPTGRFIALKGRSGSGKTTLLNCLGGLDQPTSGEVIVNGRSLSGLSEKELTHWRRSEVGFIFQSFGLLPTLSAYENVELMLRISKLARKERRDRAMHCLEMVGLEKWAGHRPYEMSGGQQQRVAIARSIANNPQLILADEATGELDSETTHEVLALFRTIIADKGITMLLATHDNLVDEYVDQVLQLGDGQILE
ncbi:MAG: ABC transporter ATP-binding protein [Anaerolineae bacterium]|nr:ABC transporter ATP-binding protein [Anaerolineae bacterium]